VGGAIFIFTGGGGGGRGIPIASVEELTKRMSNDTDNIIFNTNFIAVSSSKDQSLSHPPRPTLYLLVVLPLPTTMR